MSLLTPPALPGMSEAIAAATRYGRARFVHPDPAGWWRECCAAVDAVAAAMAEGEADPAELIARASRLLAELGDLLARRVGPGQDVLRAIAGAAPFGAGQLERVGREALPLLADAAAQLHRQATEAAARHGAPAGGTLPRRLVHRLADLYCEAFVDRDGERARPSHGDNVKGAPFTRFLEVLLRARAEAFEARHGFASPLPPAAITPKIVRLALATAEPAGGWTGR